MFLPPLTIHADFRHVTRLRLFHYRNLRLPSMSTTGVATVWCEHIIFPFHLLRYTFSAYRCILKRYEFKCRGSKFCKLSRRVPGLRFN